MGPLLNVPGVVFPDLQLALERLLATVLAPVVLLVNVVAVLEEARVADKAQVAHRATEDALVVELVLPHVQKEELPRVERLVARRARVGFGGSAGAAGRRVRVFSVAKRNVVAQLGVGREPLPAGVADVGHSGQLPGRQLGVLLVVARDDCFVNKREDFLHRTQK